MKQLFFICQNQNDQSFGLQDLFRMLEDKNKTYLIESKLDLILLHRDLYV